MKIIEFFQSKEDFKCIADFSERFACEFIYLEPGPENNLVLSCEEKVYKVPEWETVPELRKIIKKSIEIGKNLFVERYKDFELEYNDSKIY